jgi:hypothetical protein
VHEIYGSAPSPCPEPPSEGTHVRSAAVGGAGDSDEEISSFSSSSPPVCSSSKKDEVVSSSPPSSPCALAVSVCAAESGVREGVKDKNRVNSDLNRSKSWIGGCVGAAAVTRDASSSSKNSRRDVHLRSALLKASYLWPGAGSGIGGKGIFNLFSRSSSASGSLMNFKDRGGLHVVVFHHGFRGSSTDLLLYRNQLAFMDPNLVLLLAESNQKDSEAGLEALGARLAKETVSFIRDVVAKRSIQVEKLSFVAHSIGSLVVRVAIQHELLKPFHDKLHALISLSSPHLGYVYANSLMENAMSILKVGVLCFVVLCRVKCILYQYRYINNANN